MSIPLSAEGDLDLLKSVKVAVLNSRKHRRVSPWDPWIKVTRKMVDLAATPKTAIIASYGNPQYELVWHLALRTGSGVIIVCDNHLPTDQAPKKREFFLKKYAAFLKTGRHLLVSPFMNGHLPRSAEKQYCRDEVVAHLADRILVAEIRAKGHMERLTKEALAKNIPVTAYQPEKFTSANQGNRNLLELGAKPLKEHIDLPAKIIRPVVAYQSPLSLDYGKYLYHFTRRCPGPWPTQDLFEYYRSLVDEDENAAHTAFDTLRNILNEKLIRASNHLIRGHKKVVSLTSLPPGELTELIRWRRGLIRWTMEPYGLGISIKYLIGQNASPVIYGDENVWRRLPEKHKYRFQLHRPPKTDWSTEKEWRLPTDLDLSQIPTEYVLIIVIYEWEALEIKEKYGYKTVLAGMDLGGG